MIWSIITKTFQDPSSKYFKWFHDFLAVIILVSTLLVVFETVPSIAGKYITFFYYADIAIVIFFSIEYLVRFVSDEKPLRYMFSAMGLVDLVAILPSLALFGVPSASPTIRLLRIIRSIRILRLLRVIRLIRFFGGTKKGSDRVEQAEELLPFVNIEIYFFALFIVVTFSASLMYLAEGQIVNTAFRTIPDGMWWAITTVTTVGYGDIVPITTAGKIIASLTMLSGFALLALLLSVIGPALQVLLFGTRLEAQKQAQKELGLDMSSNTNLTTKSVSKRKPRVAKKVVKVKDGE